MKNALLALSLVSLVACGKEDAATDSDVLMSSDIDSIVGWVADPNALVKGEAHSGQYSLRVDPTHEFSPGFTSVIGRMTATRPRGVKLEAWVYATDKNSAAKLEFLIKEADGKEALRNQIQIAEAAGSYGKWVKVSRDIVFPKTVSYSSQIILYVSRAEATSPAYVDDITLTALR